MKPPLFSGNTDDYQTPPNAIIPLLPYIPHGSVIWECACGKGNLVREFERRGFQCIGSDALTNQYFQWWEPEKYDVIVTNPPFSHKTEFLQRAYELGKPFAFLLPLTTFESKDRQELFKRFGVEVIFFDKRINFEKKDGGGAGSWFATAWFTYNFNIGKSITFNEFID